MGIAPIGQVHAALAGVIFATPIHPALIPTFLAANTDDLDAVAEHLKQVAASERIFLFHGEMGAGKTTLIQAFCQKMGVTDRMSSPTFSLVNEYESADGPIYHFDLYRVENEAELFDIGLEEYLYSGYICVVEWPEMAPSLFPTKHVSVDIEVDGSTRKISVILQP